MTCSQRGQATILNFKIGKCTRGQMITAYLRVQCPVYQTVRQSKRQPVNIRPLPSIKSTFWWGGQGADVHRIGKRVKFLFAPILGDPGANSRDYIRFPLFDPDYKPSGLRGWLTPRSPLIRRWGGGGGGHFLGVRYRVCACGCGRIFTTVLTI